MQHELTAGPLLDVAGRLMEAGYATDERKRYDRNAIAAPWWRVKEWDYYGLFGPDHGLGLVLADLGYLGMMLVTWIDFKAPRMVQKSVLLPLPRGAMRLPASADVGDVTVSHGGLSIAFRHVDSGRRLTVSAEKFDGDAGFEADLLVTAPETERTTVAIPFAGKAKAFYYNQKINCLAASGEVRIGNRGYAFDPDRHMGVLDWGRGVWPYDNTWYWGSASGLIDGKPFGFNIGYGFGDTSAASENMVLWGGRAHKLDQVSFHIPEQGYDKGTWRFTSNDGRFEMMMDPVFDRFDHTNALAIRSSTHQTFGRFSGHVVLDDGTRLDVPEIFGFAEKVLNRW